MPYYSDELKEEIINVADIVLEVGEYVKLTRRGQNYVGYCPFHKEKTGSFTVSPTKQMYKCFGCGVGGNVIHFISKIENMDYGETLEFLAEKNHIDVNKYIKSSSYKPVDKDLKESIFNINKDAARYFYDALQEQLKDKESLVSTYIKKRKLDMDTITRFGIGYGTAKGQSLFDYLTSRGYDKDDIVKAGVVTISKNNNIYEWLSSRLIFPILDTRDRVIAFGGRVLDNSLPKYINSPENVVYFKGNNLFGLNVAKRNTQNYLILTEGYMDAIALHKSKITSAVASLGTALTENQAKLIKKFAPLCIIGYDQDEAGQKATLRAIDILLAQGLKVKVLALDHKDAKDPDEYINKYGVENFLSCVQKSESYVEYKVRRLKESNEIESFDGKLEFLNSVVNIFASIENDIEREMYIDDISKKFGIDKSVLLAQLNKKINKVQNIERIQENIEPRTLLRKRAGMTDSRYRQEEYIIALLLSDDKNTAKYIAEKFKDSCFSSLKLKELFIKLIDLQVQNNKIKVLTRFDDEETLKVLTDIMSIDLDECDKVKLVSDLEFSFKRYEYMNRRDEILQKLNSENTSEDEKTFLSIELSQLMKKMSKTR